MEVSFRDQDKQNKDDPVFGYLTQLNDNLKKDNDLLRLKIDDLQSKVVDLIKSSFKDLKSEIKMPLDVATGRARYIYLY